LPIEYLAKLWAAALVAAGGGWGVRHFFGQHSPVLMAVLALAPYGLIYFAAAAMLGVEESRALFRRGLGAMGRR
jgi:hypothetical protein